MWTSPTRGWAHSQPKHEHRVAGLELRKGSQKCFCQTRGPLRQQQPDGSFMGESMDPAWAGQGTTQRPPRFVLNPGRFLGRKQSPEAPAWTHGKPNNGNVSLTKMLLVWVAGSFFSSFFLFSFFFFFYIEDVSFTVTEVKCFLIYLLFCA